ncbi:VOC family protein [Pseudoruegeria sp. HB172150]|uniref:VOC family protein n=1 Tax=Pseudoruegeria sp. HB172150 TaxID=2721164 RepID=UPI0015558692|nr:VOC family protein [Pseudoruegeria sp. HB172150]
MQRIEGFGGFFFRAKDPDALAKWYHDHLGISPVPTDAGTLPWMAEGGPTVFAPFRADTDYFSADKSFMLNFRVRDMDAMLAQLRGAGIEVTNEAVMEGIGRFAHIHDPEGTPIELWEPVAG